MPSLLVVASMTVTEVTTRIALVGGLALVGLLLLTRSFSTGDRRHESTFVVINPADSSSPGPVASSWLSQRLGVATWRAFRPRTVASRAMFLVALALVSGLALGVGLALALVALLTGLNTGLN